MGLPEFPLSLLTEGREKDLAVVPDEIAFSKR
jgi:hypothetical protein